VSASDLTRQDIEAIIELIQSVPDVSEFSLKHRGVEIYIARDVPGAERVRHGRTSNETPARSRGGDGADAASVADAAAAATPALVTAPGDVVVKAPMVGTFYRAPAPGEPPFVEVERDVQRDDVLCIIEVMKLMNSIPAPQAGRIKAILVENGHPVEFGQALMVISSGD
jgi:acetyl-CoA carboxylase biotin carboxyl carrier protein